MNAGLLGEHLASPRTATKTNQSTALDQKPAKSGDSSNKDEFASLVTKEAEPAPSDSAPEDSALAAAQISETAASKAQAQSVGLELTPGAADQTLTANSDLEAEAKLNAAKADTASAEIPTTDEAALRASKGAATLDPARAKEAGEIVSADPRVRSQAELRDVTRDSTIKLEVPTDTISADATARGVDSNQTNPFTEGADTLRVETPRGEADPTRTAQNFADAETSFRQTVSTDITAVDRLTTGVAREVTTVIPDTATPLAATPTVSTTTTPTAGLTPTAPSIPLAPPNELTGIIVNAINNGIDPQEQLVVQMDPPELGRVLIDFKFDAQGLQQIVVTTENPEALKRLRELHFELTQALRDHGLSEQNMSFRQQADDQSQRGWGGSDSANQDTGIFAAEDRRTSPSIAPQASSMTPRDRLDLLL